MARTNVLLALITLAVTILLIGCGGNPSAPPTTSTPPSTPTPPTTTPVATPPTSGGGTGTGGGTSTSGTAQWTSSVAGATGTVTVSTAGDVTVQVTGGEPSTSFSGNFCQFPGRDYDIQNQSPCFSLNTTLMTDAGGNGQLTFHFPRSGPWAGAFVFAPGGDTNNPSRSTTDVIGSVGTLSSPLVPESKINQGRAPSYFFTGSPQEPGGGSASLSGGKVTVTLKGVTPNATFVVHQCFSGAGSGCQIPGTMTTDASGNGSATMTVASSTGSIFDVYQGDLKTYGLVTGFTVP